MHKMIPPYDNIPVNPDGPNMADYDEVAGSYALSVPEHFNHGFDVIDRQGLRHPGPGS